MAASSIAVSALCLALCLSVVGCRRQTEPVSFVGVADPLVSKQLIFGFYEVSDNRWRWTAPTCMVALKPPAPLAGGPLSPVRLVVDLYFPKAEVDQLGPITLTAATACSTFGSQTYKHGGPHTFTADVPSSLLCTNILPVTISLDKFLPPSRSDSRSLGMVMNSVSLKVGR